MGVQIVDPGTRIYDLGAQIIDSGARINDLGAQIINYGTRNYDLGTQIIDLSGRERGPLYILILPGDEGRSGAARTREGRWVI